METFLKYLPTCSEVLLPCIVLSVQENLMDSLIKTQLTKTITAFLAISSTTRICLRKIMNKKVFEIIKYNYVVTLLNYQISIHYIYKFNSSWIQMKCLLNNRIWDWKHSWYSFSLTDFSVYIFRAKVFGEHTRLECPFWKCSIYHILFTFVWILNFIISTEIDIDIILHRIGLRSS